MSNAIIIKSYDSVDDEYVSGIFLRSEIIGVLDDSESIGNIILVFRNGTQSSVYVGSDENGSTTEFILKIMSDLGWY